MCVRGGGGAVVCTMVCRWRSEELILSLDLLLWVLGIELRLLGLVASAFTADPPSFILTKQFYLHKMSGITNLVG